ncbi:hypothetical protein HJFPF1_00954 [Paramyrothecium foliicola]|nr:hypothetical protein HJFPF1_00954 [Paramyrothecium foliicola]
MVPYPSEKKRPLQCRTQEALPDVVLDGRPAVEYALSNHTCRFSVGETQTNIEKGRKERNTGALYTGKYETINQ